MKTSGFLASCVLMVGCGGGDSSGPQTSHQMAGTWSYEMPLLEDGHGLRCSITGPVLTLTQQAGAVTFGGQVTGGIERCTWTGGADSGSMPTANVLDGTINGDSMTFNVLNSLWHNVGEFVTEDSMSGTVNSIYSVGGVQHYIVGYWYSRRQP